MVDTRQVRHRLAEVLRTDADLDAFCLDFFHAVSLRFSNGMDRLSKVNLLLELIPDPAEILTSLEKHEADKGPAPVPAAVSPPRPQVALGKLSMNVPALIGRKDELTQLDQAWDGPKRRQIVAVVAMGGQGKTRTWCRHRFLS
jgi:hypothetical protein